MKRIILFVAASVFSVAMVNAQTDSTKSTTTTTSKSQTNYYQNYPTKDMKKVSTTDIPASLRTTLQGSEYKGWENGTIYFNSTTNEYSYQAAPGKGANATSVKNKNTGWYRFDQSGTRIPDTKPNN